MDDQLTQPFQALKTQTQTAPEFDNNGQSTSPTAVPYIKQHTYVCCVHAPWAKETATGRPLLFNARFLSLQQAFRLSLFRAEAFLFSHFLLQRGHPVEGGRGVKGRELLILFTSHNRA